MTFWHQVLYPTSVRCLGPASALSLKTHTAHAGSMHSLIFVLWVRAQGTPPSSVSSTCLPDCSFNSPARLGRVHEQITCTDTELWTWSHGKQLNPELKNTRQAVAVSHRAQPHKHIDQQPAYMQSSCFYSPSPVHFSLFCSSLPCLWPFSQRFHNNPVSS